MAKIKITKKRRTNPIFKLGFTILILALLVSVADGIFVRGSAVALQVEIQRTQARIRAMSIENEALAVEIEELTTYQRVSEIANNAGLDRNLANHVAIEGH